MSGGSQRDQGWSRPPAVAGMFYPGRARELQELVEKLLAEARPAVEVVPRALIAPHAGYVYSGPIAASAFGLLPPVKEQIRRVLLLGPTHYVPVKGLALSRAGSFSTPLGEIPVDTAACARLADHEAVTWVDEAHAREHSLEVELPFLQTVLGEFELVPLTVGEASPEVVAEVIATLWDEETLVVVSTDLSHYLPYDTASRVDAETISAICHCDVERLRPDRACGVRALAGLLLLARERGLEVTALDVRSSGDTAGDHGQVVGYGAFAVH